MEWDAGERNSGQRKGEKRKRERGNANPGDEREITCNTKGAIEMERAEGQGHEMQVAVTVLRANL